MSANAISSERSRVIPTPSTNSWCSSFRAYQDFLIEVLQLLRIHCYQLKWPSRSETIPEAMEPPSTKRRRLSNGDGVRDSDDSLPRSLNLPVSPPRRRDRTQPSPPSNSNGTVAAPSSTSSDKEVEAFDSPFQLTWIRDLPEVANKDAVTLRDLLGDPLIAECWEFNFLHDIDFLMAAFDQDVRDTVDVHVVHGFWKKEDQSRMLLQVSLNVNRRVEWVTYTNRREGASRRVPERQSSLRVHA